MKIQTPEIAWFMRKPILSLDFQLKGGKTSTDSGGYRLATSAIPDENAYVRLWRIDLEKSPDAGPKLNVVFLCSLGYHQTVVNAVKFSPCDPYLATADSEGVVVIWKLDENPSTAPDIFAGDGGNGGDADDDEESEEGKPLERWERLSTFRQHRPGEDVVDICWSPDGKRLVSCSIDHSLIIWDVENRRKLKQLNEHESRHPMGVTWDPRSEFIVSLANARIMTIYDAADTRYSRLYTVNKASIPSALDPERQVMTSLFHDFDTLFSLSRRLCFSPCGELLFAPAGVIEEGTTLTSATYIFTRHQMTKPAIALTSAKEIPFAVRCCPLVFELRSSGPPSVFELPYRIVFAVLTKASVIFYDTQSCEPFAYASNMQHGRTLDLSWTDDGRCLVISAEEGYCTFITFDENELGTPLRTIPKPPSPPEPEPEPAPAPVPAPSPPSPGPPPPLPVHPAPVVLQSPNTLRHYWNRQPKE